MKPKPVRDKNGREDGGEVEHCGGDEEHQGGEVGAAEDGVTRGGGGDAGGGDPPDPPRRPVAGRRPAGEAGPRFNFLLARATDQTAADARAGKFADPKEMATAFQSLVTSELLRDVLQPGEPGRGQ